MVPTRIPIPFLLLAAAACQPMVVTMSQEEADAIVSEIEARTMEMNALGAANELEPMMAFFSSHVDSLYGGDPALFLHGITMLPDVQAVREAFAPMTGARSGTNYALVENHVLPLSAATALQVAVQHFSVVDTLGVAGPLYPVASTTLWRKENGAWKIAHFHQSWSDTPVEAPTESR